MSDTDTSLRNHITSAATVLAQASVPSPRHDAELLAAHVLGVERGDLVTHPEPAPGFEATYNALVARRAEREPLQHLTGRAYFRHNTLDVGSGVFIPRPETELTAGAAIDEAAELVAAGRVPTVVDLFAGCGAIAIAVATEVRPCVVHAVEREDEAIPWLRGNVAGMSIIVHRDDVAGVPERSMSMLLGQVDVVVANPPYVATGAHIRDPEVAEHDPAAALWSGADGLDAMRTLERVAARLLSPGGIVIGEHADVQGFSAPDVFRAGDGWSDVADHADLNGRPRYVTARRTPDSSR